MDVNMYKCPNCEAPLVFNPEAGDFKCDYCNSHFSKSEVDELYKKESEKLQEKASDNKDETLETYVCENCGAELIVDGTAVTTNCLYCKSPAIIKTKLKGSFKPRYIIPFELTEKEAKNIYSEWIKGKILAPSVFKNKKEIDSIKGVYAPFWLFNCNAKGSIEGRGEKTRRTYTRGDYRYTDHDVYRVFREGASCYEKVPVDGSSKLDDDLMNLAEPFDYSKLIDFDMPYLSGFFAEKYDVDDKESETVANKRISTFLETRLKSTIFGYAPLTISNSDVNLQDLNCNYAMLPIYLLVSLYKGEKHTFIVNGQTGKIVGEVPISKKIFAIMALLIFLATWLLLSLGGVFLA